MTDLLPDRPLTLAELAERWQVSVRTLRDLAVRGQLPCFKVGTQYRFRLHDVEAHERGRVRAPDCTEEAITPSGRKTVGPAVRPSTPRIVLLPNRGSQTI